MMGYIYDQKGWPKFHWRLEFLSGQLASVRHSQGRLIGRMEGIGLARRAEATLQTLTEDVLKSSEIEDEVLDKEQVRSALARRLGMDTGALTPADRQVDGVVAMMVDATQQYDTKLTVERLFDWHAALFPTGRRGMSQVTAGAWRTDSTGPMQVVSGLAGRERVHYQAPEAGRLDQEMRAFLDWFNAGDQFDPVMKAGVAHLWFVTIHPFDDGNGRIARAIADMALARSEHSAQRFYSMSAQIRRERVAYFATLAATQQGDLDITAWLDWFLGCLGHAVDNVDRVLGSVLHKARFWDTHAGAPINARQHAVIDRLLDGFEGKLTSSKWAALTKCSQDTALRDIDDLVNHGILQRGPAGGRSTSYTMAEFG
jgi:Fic family protein